VRALHEADLASARAALADVEPAGPLALDRDRLTALHARLPSLEDSRAADPVALHAAFEAVLTGCEFPEGGVSPEDWFQLYGRYIATAMERVPDREFRGWFAVHFWLGLGSPPDALRAARHLVIALPAGRAWVEAARAAHAAGEGEPGTRWLLVSCVASPSGLDPRPPRLVDAETTALNRPPLRLPELPERIRALWEEVEGLELPGPASAWVPALGIINGAFSPSLLGWKADLRAAGFDSDGDPSPAEPPPHAFLRALIAALRARSVAAGHGGAAYPAGELDARRVMRRLAPELLERYLKRLGR
jgi:hypothetical protein